MITLLDGSIGQEIVTRAGTRPTGLWSTAVMLEQPGIVEDVHRDYFKAGAQIATANTYAIHRDRLRPNDLEDKFETLHLTALDAASRAREAHGSGAIAGALGPLVASYRPDLSPAADIAADIYAEIARLHAPHVDFFICETMASIDMARGAAMGASVAGKPIWMALSPDDTDGTRLRSGEALADAVTALADLPIAALLLNCALPEAISAGLPRLPKSMPNGAYANGFTEINPEFAKPGAAVDLLAPRTDLDPAAYGTFAAGWLDAGATIIGGCCEIGPAHIAHLHDLILTSGRSLAPTLPGQMPHSQDTKPEGTPQ